MGENIQLKSDNIPSENNQSALFQDILDNEELVDVTLVNDEMEFPAHKVILASMSQIFRKILKRQKGNNNTSIYLRGVKSCQINALISFIYNRETSIPREDLQDFINLARDLKVNGIGDVSKINDLVKEHNDKVLEKEVGNKDNEHMTFSQVIEEVKITKMSTEDDPTESLDLGERSDLPQIQIEEEKKSSALINTLEVNSPKKPQKRKKRLKLKPRKQGTRLDLTYGEEPITSHEEFKEERERFVSRSEDGDGWFCNSDGCSFFATERQKVTSHIEVHIRVKLTCPFCEKVLYRYEYWRRHIYKCHPENKYDVFPERKPKPRPAPADMIKTVVKYW